MPYSPATGLPIESQTVTQMVDRVLALPEGTRLYLLAPIVRGRKGEYRKELAELQKKGFQRVKINGKFYEIAEAPKLDKKYKHDIDVVVDRIVVRKDIGRRLADSFETALELADGIAIAEYADKPLKASLSRPRGERVRGGAANHGGRRCRPHPSPSPQRVGGEGAEHDKDVLRNKNETHERIIFSARFACPVSGFTIDEIEPRLFSFNAPAGACPTCDGLGTEMRFEPELVVPDHDAQPEAGRRRSLGQDGQHLALLRADAGGARQALQGVDDDAVGEAAQEGAGRHPVRHRPRRRSPSSTRTACAATRTPSRSRA